MKAASIPVDLSNPGQVFACLGLLETADVLFGYSEGGFEWINGGTTIFTLSADAGQSPTKEILAFIRDAKVSAVSPRSGIQERDGGATSFDLGIHPCKITDEKGKIRSALLPIRLSVGDQALLVDSWADFDSGRELLQLWTATNGNSAFVRFSKLHAAYKAALSKSVNWAGDPFNLPAPVAANFRLELRRNWTAINLGFSPDKINKGSGCVPIELITYPVVELLAAIGLNHARPAKRTKLEWAYSAWSVPLPASFARAAISGGLLPDICRQFRMVLEEPNDGGDLSIANSYEELHSS
jgi:CRISPR-associated protein Csx14